MVITRTQPVADAVVGNWVDRHAPDWLKPFARLARWDRPIGAWLLFWPCAWSAGLAAVAAGHAAPNSWHVVLFFIGAFAMRGAGCTWNDIVDRDIDAQIARTASRPLPSGQISTRAAAVFLTLQLAIGVIVLVQFNLFTIALGAASVVPVITYPFMKRITWWPQVNLGICFGWGALMGWAAVFSELETAPLLLYAGAIAWVIGYDTIYALQDIEDDALVGVRSTARLFGGQVKMWLWSFYALAVILFSAAFVSAGAGVAAFAGLGLFAVHLARQVIVLKPANARQCLALFKSNSAAGFVLLMGLIADVAL